MKKKAFHWANRIKDSSGSSIVSVMVAFVILLIGISGFYTAVNTAGNLVRRAEALNTATGMAVKEFYQRYPHRISWADHVPEGMDHPPILKFYTADEDGKPTDGTNVFTLNGALGEMEFEATVGSEASDTITYHMHYYK